MNIRSMQRGQLIANYRKEHGMTQKELGELLDLSAKSISSWETGRSEPNMGQAYELARILGFNVFELMNPPQMPNEQLLKRELIALTEAYKKADETTREMVKRILKIDEFFHPKDDRFPDAN
ncbi:MAG: helix-turn-helix transcriptional regulator [Lachnospiraceae bacterium]|nr:helix-turn-helix transcriptional regulator [Lachnospiraceae bacterium]